MKKILVPLLTLLLGIKTKYLMQFNILIIDDEKLVCNSIKRLLKDNEKEIYTALNIDNARKVLRNNPIDLILLDYKLGPTDGITVLKEIQEYYPDISIIMLTAHGTIDLAVSAMKNGAYDFIQKGEDTIILRHTVEKALDNLRLRKEVEKLKVECQENMELPTIISFSSRMSEVIDLAKLFAETDSTVLITGETGTGKNLLARYIHSQSSRFNNTFLTINCAAIPYELIESELFGYESGAFTGARQKGKVGLIEQANGGTLVLDEIGDMNLDLQTRFLHVLENNEFYRIGGTRLRKINVRFIATTNSNLADLVKTKKFRPDLYYRLNVANLEIPALRKRKSDIIPLTKYFIEEFNKIFNKSISKIDKDMESFLLSAAWPGNIRELRNFIERSVLLIKTEILHLDDTHKIDSAVLQQLTEVQSKTFNVHLNPQPESNLLHIAQKQLIDQALELTKYNHTKAAKLLGIPRTSLNYYIKRYNDKISKHQNPL